MRANPRTLTDKQARAMRAAYSRDLCRCDHLRQSHYDAWGASGACHRPDCRCSVYSWNQEVDADCPWF